jgi:2-haloacid dehalogenase
MLGRRYDSVLFDLLTALLDSWTLWNNVAGSEEAGRRWRAEYLRITYRTGQYRSYGALVGEAAEKVGLPRGLTDVLDARYAELKPWPGVTDTLRALKSSGLRLGVVTNCSERLGRIAVAAVGIDFDTVITAERAGFYKPHERPYRLGLQALESAPARCLFVAGSSYDLTGTAKVGLDTFWHNRVGLVLPPDAPKPLYHSRTIDLLSEVALAR